MLQLFKAGSVFREDAVADLKSEAFHEESLLDIRFLDSGGSLLGTEHSLTKYRRRNSVGTTVSFELRRGVVHGIELLGVKEGGWDKVVPAFMDEVELVQEVPILGFELDGKNTNADIGLITVDQESELSIIWAENQRILEIQFGEFWHGSDFGDGIIQYDRNFNVSGVRVRLPSKIKGERE